MSRAPREHILHVLRSVEERIASRRDHGALLDADTVLALDVVAHALAFDRTPQALMHWREALWQRTLSPPVRAAVGGMLEYLMNALARGDMQAITDICDCLQAVVEPGAFSGDDRADGPAPPVTESAAA